jgi:hypothetical protein
MNHYTRKPVQYFAEEAKWFLTQIAENQVVRLEVQESPRSRDRYGRLLAYAYRQSDGLFINKEIIQQGFGFAYLKYPFDPVRMEEFRAAESQARDGRKGLWGPVVERYQQDSVPRHETRAEAWIRMGDNLAKTNPSASKDWYRRVLTDFPKAIEAAIARERLKLPKAERAPLPPLDGQLAMTMLPELQGATVARPSLPPPPSPRAESATRTTEETGTVSSAPDQPKPREAPYGTTVTGIPTYVGPRGGVYHYSPSGRKVYERRRK